MDHELGQVLEHAAEGMASTGPWKGYLCQIPFAGDPQDIGCDSHQAHGTYLLAHPSQFKGFGTAARNGTHSSS